MVKETQESPAKGKTPLQELDDLAVELKNARNNPLLILYYADAYGQMRDADVRTVYDEFRRNVWQKSNPKGKVDVIVHTYGGVPFVGYMVAQVIRDFSKHVNFIIPEYAFSAGTLLCLSANEILLADHALLSPIDITLQSVRKSGTEITELVSIDYFMKFAEDCKLKMESMIAEQDLEASSTVDSDLLVQLVKEVGALNVGKFYRLRQYSEQYAMRLLTDYMFASEQNSQHLAEEICKKLLYEYPSHNFVMDYHLCDVLGLPVVEMNQSESDKAKNIIRKLRTLTDSGIVCKNVDKDYKIPFIRLYD